MHAALVVAAAALLTDFNTALCSTAYWAHADAPGFALAGLALCLVLFTTEGNRLAWATAAGGLAAGAVLAKQNFIGVWFALFFCVLPCGRRVAARFAAGAALVAAVFGTILSFTRSWSSFLFNCIYIPSHHPLILKHSIELFGSGWAGGVAQKLQAIIQAFLEIAPTWYPWLAVGAWILWWTRRAAPGSPTSRLYVPIWVFAAQLPISLLAYRKVGGDVNNLTDSLYFLVFAICALALAAAANRARSAGQHAILTILVGILIVCNAPRLLFLIYDSKQSDPNAPMMNFLRQHPRQVYLPWNPLLTGLSDGVDYHFEYGVFDRALAGAPLAPDVYWAHLPSKIRYVAARRVLLDANYMKFLNSSRNFVEPIVAGGDHSNAGTPQSPRLGAVWESLKYFLSSQQANSGIGAKDLEASRALIRNPPQSANSMFLSYLPLLREYPSPAGLEEWKFYVVPQSPKAADDELNLMR
jgi:hypothetical protein